MRISDMAATAATVLSLLATPALAAERSYGVAPFDGVSVSADVTAIVVAGGGQTVEAEADSDAILNRLAVRVVDGTLEVGLDSGLLDFLFNFGQRDNIVVHVSAPAIARVGASSGANVDATGMTGPAVSFEASSGASLAVKDADGRGVTARASSGARLAVAGTCGSLVAESSSGGNVQARDLSCDSVDANASSGAGLEVTAKAAIKANASSGGGITVHGAPASSTVNSSSGGSVNFAP